MEYRAGTALAVGLALFTTSAAAATPPAGECRSATSFTETFASGSNVGGWTFGFGGEFFDDERGRNKEFLHAPGLDTFYPIAATTQPSVFTGNYAARGVNELAVELATIRYATTDHRFHSPTIVLTNRMGTPDDPADDCIVFFQSGLDMPPANEPKLSWVRYAFSIPSTSPTLPQPNNGDPCPGAFCETCILPGDPDPTGKPCWGVWKGTNCPVLDDLDLTWRTVIENVDQVSVQWLSIEWLSAFAIWDVGVDNPSVSTCE